MDLIEISVPYLAIVTVSIDRILRCFRDQRLLWQVTEENCLKQVDYTPLFGASLLVVGFSCYFTVWDIQN